MTRRRLAAIAFLLHGPGLRLVARARLGPRLLRRNGVALALTLAAMLAAGLAAEARPGLAVLVAWLIGHFAWSAALTRAVLRGELGAP